VLGVTQRRRKKRVPAEARGGSHQELRAIEKEEKRIKALRRDAVLWRRAQRIRDYVAAVRQKAFDLADETKKDGTPRMGDMGWPTSRSLGSAESTAAQHCG